MLMVAFSAAPRSEPPAGEGEPRSIDGIQRAIKAYVVDSFLLDEGELDLDTSLIESGVIDSTGIMEIVSFVEETYGIEVDEHDLVPENFDSVSRLACYVVANMESNNSGAG
jgi:acyl carrier protein